MALSAQLGAQPPIGTPGAQTRVQEESLLRELIEMEKADQPARTAMFKSLGEKGISLTSGKPITDQEGGQSSRKRYRGWRRWMVPISHGSRLSSRSTYGPTGRWSGKMERKCLKLMEAAPAGVRECGIRQAAR